MSFLDFLKNLFGNNKKNARLITKDLTKTFGEGCEPSKEWCDKNIPYFEKEYEINQIKKHIEFTCKDSFVFDEKTNKYYSNTYSPKISFIVRNVDKEYNTNNLSVAKAIKKVSDAQLDLTAATTPLCIMLNDTNTKDFSKSITESTNAVVTGNTATGSVSVQITTKKVNYLLDNTQVSGDGLVHVNLNAGDFGYTFIGVEGIDVKSMVAIGDTLNPGGKPYSYSMVVYYDDGDQEYAYTDTNKPKTVTGKTPSLKHEYDGNFGVSLDSNSCGMQKGFALQPDPETNGFLLVTNNDAAMFLQSTEATTKAAMSAGTYRMSIMIHYPEQSTTGSHDVLDFGVVYMGCPVTNYQGAHTYTATPDDFHVVF